MSENKAVYTPSEALKYLHDVSKNALYEDMNNGVLSYSTEPWGKKTRRLIQGVELARVYGEKFNPANNIETSSENESGQHETSQETQKTSNETNVLQVEVEVLRERLKDKEAIIADKDKLLEKAEMREKDLSNKLDNMQKNLERQTYLLEDTRNRTGEEASQKPIETRKGFWATLLGKTG